MGIPYGSVQLRSSLAQCSSSYCCGRRHNAAKQSLAQLLILNQICRVKSVSKYFSTDGGDGELRTSVYPSNLAPIGAKLRQRAFQTICKFRFFDVEKCFSQKNSDFVFGFSLFSADFRGARLFLTSKSSSSRNFASDGQISRSVRHLEPIFQVRPLAKY